MPATPKKIAFDDIKTGDTIRVVDVRDVKISRAGMDMEVWIEGGGALLRDGLVNESKRTFQLLDREQTPLPEELGSVIEINGQRYVLVYDMFAPTNLWVHINTGRKDTPKTLQARANLENGFEVIA